MPLTSRSAITAAVLGSMGWRPMFQRVLDLSGATGEVLEFTLPDGTVNRVALPPRGGRLQSLLVTSDKAIQVCMGDVARNTPLWLMPGGCLAFLDMDAPATQMCALSYAPGDGSVARCLVVAVVYSEAWAWTEGWDALLPPFVPVTLWTEGWETT